MILTTETLLKKFNKFNDEFFNSELPVINIVLTREKRRFGYFEYSRQYNSTTLRTVNVPVKIGISTYFDLPEQHIDETLIHEMIHYYIAYKNIKDNNQHGRYFMMYADRISSKSKYNIEKTGSSAGYVPSKKSNKEYYIVTFNFRGKDYFSRISKSRIGNSSDILSDFSQVTDISFYKSNDIQLDGYRQCTSRLSLNSISKLEGVKLTKID